MKVIVLVSIFLALLAIEIHALQEIVDSDSGVTPAPFDIQKDDCETLKKKVTAESGAEFIEKLLKRRGSHADMMKLFRCLVPVFKYGSFDWQMKLMPGNKCDVFTDIVNKVSQKLIHIPDHWLTRGVELMAERFSLADQKLDINLSLELQALWKVCMPGKPYEELGTSDKPADEGCVKVEVTLSKECKGRFDVLSVNAFAFQGVLVHPYPAPLLHTDWMPRDFSTVMNVCPSKNEPKAGIVLQVVDAGPMQFDGILCMVNAYYKKLGKEPAKLVVANSSVSTCPFEIVEADDSTEDHFRIRVNWKGFPYNYNVREGPSNRN